MIYIFVRYCMHGDNWYSSTPSLHVYKYGVDCVTNRTLLVSWRKKCRQTVRPYDYCRLRTDSSIANATLAASFRWMDDQVQRLRVNLMRIRNCSQSVLGELLLQFQEHIVLRLTSHYASLLVAVYRPEFLLFGTSSIDHIFEPMLFQIILGQ